MKPFDLAGHANSIRGTDGTGRFATQQLAEPPSLTETSALPSTEHIMPAREVRELATSQLGDRVRAEAAKNIRDWRGNHWMHSTIGFGPKPPKPMRDNAQEAKGFEQLDRKHQDEMVDIRLAQLMDTDLRFGNDRVQVAPDLKPDPGSVLIGLAAQLRMKESGIPGEITFTGLSEGEARFEVADQGFVHKVGFSQNTSRFRRSITPEPGSTDTGWLSRADNGIKVSGSSKTDNFTERPGYFRRDYAEHHEQAMLFDTMENSPFREASRHFASAKLSDRSAEFKDPKGQYSVGCRGDKPSVINDQGVQLRDDEAAKVLDRLATTTGQRSGEELHKNLVDVFEETERRLKR